MTDDTREPWISQQDKELSRMVADGTRTDDGQKCSLFVGAPHRLVTVYPHGWDRLGVVLSDREARRVAQMILDGK